VPSGPDKLSAMKEGVTLVLMRNAFYRDNYRRAVMAVFLVMIVNAILGIFIVHRYLNPPKPQYFATNAQYQLIKWHPLSDPVFDDNYVLQWLSTAVQQAFNLDFIHWKQQLQEASNNFTPTGWHWFSSAFQQSGNLKTLTDLKMVSNVTVTGAPGMVKEGVLQGSYVWEISIPILITYTSVQRVIQQPLKVTVYVTRVPVQYYPGQIAIDQFLPEAQGGGTQS